MDLKFKICEIIKHTSDVSQKVSFQYFSQENKKIIKMHFFVFNNHTNVMNSI